ncbi:MAG: ASKHA domain-containing protein [Victivallaceae bacterium]
MLIKIDHESFVLNATGRNIGSVLHDAGIPIDMRCSGKGICGKCEIILEYGKFEVDGSAVTIKDKPLKAKACLTLAVDEDAVISIPKKSLASAKLQCAEAFHLQRFDLKPERPGIAAAVDVGTTTVAVALIDTADGALIGTASDYNKQFKYGDNVISRIVFSTEIPGNLQILQRAVIDHTINPLLKRLCAKNNLKPEDIQQVSIAGNTVMEHIFFGLSPESIGVIPFEPLTNIYPVTTAGELGLLTAKNALVKAVPSASGYIGGDITAGVLTSEIIGQSGVSVLVDIGTNCETILVREHRVYSCASAAGPAFEGAGVSCGCRAADGAIEHIAMNGEFEFKLSIIGAVAPTGLCGSAMIDFVAESARTGLINQFGRYDVDLLKSLGRFVQLENNIIGCRISDDGNVFVSEKDLEQILKAKAAVFAGLQTLCQAEKCSFDDINRIYLAGGFAKYIEVKHAVGIGMLPAVPLERYIKIGNSSLAGAVLNAIDSGATEKFLQITGQIENVVLNTVPEFEFNYIDALLLP